MIINPNTCYMGDCLEIMPFIPSQSIDLILCDLPYGTTQAHWDTVIPFDKLWLQYERIIKPAGLIILTAANPFSSLLVASNLKLFKYELIYQKTLPTGHLNAKKQPLRVHENVLVFYKKHGTYNPQKTYGHKLKTAHTDYSKSADGASVYGKENRNTFYSSTERYPLSVQIFSNGNQTEKIHATQKPTSLFEYLIKTYSNEGNVVLDNCSGSGTTGIACINTNRNYILIEKDPVEFEKGQQRIIKHLLGDMY